MCLFFVAVLAILTFYLLERLLRSFKVGGIANKCVFITGCDTGFGQLLALHLDKLGFPVFASCLTEKGQQYLEENASSRLKTLSLDVTKKESIGDALSFVKGELQTGTYLWAIVNNAGIGGPTVPIEMCPPEEMYKTSAVNLFGAIEMCRRFLPLLRQSKGRVVNVVSVAGRIACVFAPYNVSKFAMEGFSDTLRREVRDQGIKVSIIEPGFFKTDIVAREPLISSFTHYFKQADEDVQTVYGKNYVEKMTNWVDNTRQTANTNIDWVVDEITHAISSKHPKSRYVIGWDAMLMFVPLSYLPAAPIDWILAQLKKKQMQPLKKK